MGLTPRLLAGDCIEMMRLLADNSVDSVVTDPPYLISFMSKSWDRSPTPAQQQEWHQAWATECLRVLKPGGHLLAFGGTRTYHRLASGIEDAGFESRDCINWVFGQGFPKSLDVSAAIDKQAGAERTERAGVKPGHENFVGRDNMHSLREGLMSQEGGFSRPWMSDPDKVEAAHWDTKPATPEAEQWDGWGTALKPAHEMIVVARKPLIGTVATNVVTHGTGAINIDGCRIPLGNEQLVTPQSDPTKREGEVGRDLGITNATVEDFQQAQRDSIERTNTLGRWPANLVLTHSAGCRAIGTRQVRSGTCPADAASIYGCALERRDLPKAGYGTETVTEYDCDPQCPVAELDAQAGLRRSGTPGFHRLGVNTSAAYGAESRLPGTPMGGYGDEGGVSRFFTTFDCDDDCPVAELDRQSGEQRSGIAVQRNGGGQRIGGGRVYAGTEGGLVRDDQGYGDEGGASRYFGQFQWSDPEPRSFHYAAKPSRSEREIGLDGLRENHPTTNIHPTVKPVALMRWLCRLVTPPGGVCLDPFMGSGTTGVAAIAERFAFIGMERDPEYFAIAQARIVHADADRESRLF